jgi:hypothetical protein
MIPGRQGKVEQGLGHRDSPLRTLSKTVSTSWVKAAMSSNPNIAPTL